LETFIVNDNEGKGRRMCQHVFHGRASCTKEGETQVRGRPEDEVPPPWANLRQLVPPALAKEVPHWAFRFIHVVEIRSNKIKDMEKRIVIEIVD
jgi:hypothetical protein